MIEIRTNFNPVRLGLEVFVLRRDYEARVTHLLVQQYRNINPDTRKTWWAWEELEAGALMPEATFFLPQDSVRFLVDDLNRDGMGVDEGSESAVAAHKDELSEILETVLPHALRGRGDG